VKGVVFDRKNGVQFEPVSNGTIYDAPTDSALLAAKLCLEGASVVGDCLYFYAPALSKGTWIVANRTYHTTIGCHRFYR
jgi:N-acetylmuramoyl-L-alanine amidase